MTRTGRTMAETHARAVARQLIQREIEQATGRTGTRRATLDALLAGKPDPSPHNLTLSPEQWRNIWQILALYAPKAQRMKKRRNAPELDLIPAPIPPAVIAALLLNWHENRMSHAITRHIRSAAAALTST